MVIFSQRWDGCDFFEGTIAIDGFSMVLLPLNHHHWMFFSLTDHWHQWFFNGFPQVLVRWLTMVLALLKDLKKLAIAKYPIFWQIHLMIEKGDNWIPQIISEFPGHFADKSKLLGLSGPHFATIAKFQWFSKAPSPLNGMVWDNHWIQWFFDGFGVRQPLDLMVFDGCLPLVRRWNGNIPSLKSSEVMWYGELKFRYKVYKT